MARRQTTPPAGETSPDSAGIFVENTVDIDVTSEMEGSFLEYAYSVIYSRALPDARDGLKPVQRRILYMMSDMGLRPDRGHVKSARVVGEVMGKLHPHGDASIYDALVRMAQPFSMRVPLVDGHGNFGSLGNDDPPAAMRYTESRMAEATSLMTESIEEDRCAGRCTPNVRPAALGRWAALSCQSTSAVRRRWPVLIGCAPASRPRPRPRGRRCGRRRGRSRRSWSRPPRRRPVVESCGGP